jgi:hypothetical protein
VHDLVILKHSAGRIAHFKGIGVAASRHTVEDFVIQHLWPDVPAAGIEHEGRPDELPTFKVAL